MKWTSRIGGGTDAAAAVADGMVYVSSLSGLLYAFHLPSK
jgi:outer membrane protein assembly factor BamB